MLNVTLGQKINPYVEAKKWLRAPEIKVCIGEDSIHIDGNLDKDFVENISSLDIAKMSNETSVKKFEPKFKERGHYTSIKANFKCEDSQEKFLRTEKRQVWYVDFGEPVGGEFGYIHPAIVLRKSSTSKEMVILPCSSKPREGRVYQLKFTHETLESADAQFLENSKNKITYVFLDQQQPVDRVRFEKYLGTLDEDIFNEILKELGFSDSDIKRNIRLENLNITEKQQKILNRTNRNSDIIGIANNTAYTYEQRVKAMLSVFGFKVQCGGDIDLLIELIKNTKKKVHIDIRQECEFLSRGRLMNPQNINGKLVELVKKQFGEDVHPCLLEFVRLVNKLVS